MPFKAVIKKTAFILPFIILSGIALPAQNLGLSENDFRIEQLTEAGFHLFVRKTQDIASVMLTESTRDPSMAADSFAYRAAEWNPVNGNEIRLLNGFPLRGVYSLVSSTPVPHPEFGEAFHIYIPWFIYFGNEDTRNGEVYVSDGTYFNVRAFNLPYADYRGNFADNPFVLHATQRIPVRPAGRFSDEAQRTFQAIANDGKGSFSYAVNAAQIIDRIENILQRESGRSVEIVVALDTTASMRPYIDGIRTGLVPMLARLTEGYSDWRIGMVEFKDYFDEYITRITPFTKDFDVFQRALNAVSIRGGGDIPEAVHEAIYEGASSFPWAAERRHIILIGDAPPHPRPRGRITREMTFAAVAERNITVSSILVPY